MNLPTDASIQPSVMLSSDFAMKSRSLLAAKSLSPEIIDGHMNQFLSHPHVTVHNTCLKRKTTLTDDTVHGDASLPSEGSFRLSQADSISITLDEAINQYNIARSNLKAQIDARKTAVEAPAVVSDHWDNSLMTRVLHQSENNDLQRILSNFKQDAGSKVDEINGYFSQPTAYDFLLDRYSKINGNNIRMNQLVNEYHAHLNQKNAELNNASASCQSFLPLRRSLVLPENHVSPLSIHSVGNLLSELHNKPMPMHSLIGDSISDLKLQHPSVLKEMLKTQNQQGMEAYFKDASNHGHSSSDKFSLFNGEFNQSNFTNNDVLSNSSQHRYMYAHENDQDYLNIRRDQLYYLNKPPCGSISNSCPLCNRPFSTPYKSGDPACNSCSFGRKKRKSDCSLNDPTSFGSTQEKVLTKSSEKWDTIPSDSLILLAADIDKNWLSNLLCFIRAQIEVFTATPNDVAARSRRGGIKQPIAVGRVGIRCIHCRHINPDHRAKGAVSYPNSIRIVHQAIRNWQRYHFMQCNEIPEKLKETYQSFRTTRSHSGNASLKYWLTSCKNLGMVDTDPENGIRYLNPKKSGEIISRPTTQMMNKSSFRQKPFIEVNQCSKNKDDESCDAQDVETKEVNNFCHEKCIPFRELPDSLLEPGMEKEISPFLALLLAQQKPTHYVAIDALGKRKTRPINFVGVECRYCCSRVAGSGRYFPLTVTSFANNNNPNNCIHIHMMKCPQCPQEIKDELTRLQSTNISDGLKLESGWKKKFFDRLWIRLHGKRFTSFDEEPSQHGESLHDKVEFCQ